MAKKPPLSIGFNVPFNEAIAAAKLRGVVLPDIYYGELQGIARQLAFSIAGVASLDQLQAVKDSLNAAMDKGVSFKDWKKTIAVQSLSLPDHRLDNIWRTNLQGNYMRGKWEQFQRNAEKRPFLMYDAINDSRVRPSHLAMDGTIRRMDDPFWKSHSPPNGYRCRCSLVSLTEAQAQQRSNGNNGINKVPVDKNGLPAMPDKGWHYNPFEDRLQWVDEALAKLDPELQAVGKKMVEQAAELVKKPVFVPATTVKEAEKWMMDNDVVDLCDFGKIKDVDLVNEWNRAMFEHIQEFPELRKNQRFTGSSQAQVRTWYKDQIAKTAEWFRQNYGGMSEAESIEKAKKIVKRMKVGNFWAWSWNQKIVQGISINEKWATQPDKLKQSLLSSLFSGFHPINCETIKSIVDHELGHQLDALLDLSSDKGIIDIRKATQDIEKELSGYAKTNIAEFIAEAWAEYRNNPNPRPVAKQVGDLIRERYAARYAAG